MYDYNFDYSYGSDIPTDVLAGLLGFLAGLWVFFAFVGVIAVVAMWFLFEKAGKPGWAAIVPFYNLYILFEITWGKGVLFLLMLIPYANFVIYIITLVKLAKVFGKGGGYACGLIFLNTIFMCILAFDKNTVYVGIPGNPYGQPGSAPGYQQPNYGTQQSPTNDQYHYQNTAPEAPTGVRFCSACGVAVEAGVKYCPKCGKSM